MIFVFKFAVDLKLSCKEKFCYGPVGTELPDKFNVSGTQNAFDNQARAISSYFFKTIKIQSKSRISAGFFQEPIFLKILADDRLAFLKSK